MDAKLGYLWGVVSVLTSMHPAWQSVQWQHHQNHSVWKGTGREKRWCRTSRARFKQWKSVLGSSVLTLQSINTSFCFSFSSSHYPLSLSAVYDKWVQNAIWLHPSMCASPINDVYSLLGLPITTILFLFTLNLLPLCTSLVRHDTERYPRAEAHICYWICLIVLEDAHPELCSIIMTFVFLKILLCVRWSVIISKPYLHTLWEIVHLWLLEQKKFRCDGTNVHHWNF